MITKFKFTQKNIAALPPHPKDSKSTDQEYSDTLVSGLKLLVGKSGNKKFLFRYSLRSRKCSTGLGSFGALSVDEARIIANQHKALVSQGRDPKQERDDFKSRISFGDFVAKHTYRTSQLTKGVSPAMNLNYAYIYCPSSVKYLCRTSPPKTYRATTTTCASLCHRPPPIVTCPYCII